MPAWLIVSAFLLDAFGVLLGGIQLGIGGVLALIAVFVLMGSLYSGQLVGANPLLKVGPESICLVCAIYPAHGLLSSLLSNGAGKDNMVALLAFVDFAVTVVGYFCLLFGTVWLIFF